MGKSPCAGGLSDGVFGSMTVGSAVWGQLASHFSIPVSLCIAAAGMFIASTTVFRWRLDKDPDLNLDASSGSEAIPAIDIHHDRGPVMVSYEYLIHADDARQFIVCMQDMRRVRRRGGAINWCVYEDILQPGIFVETFVVASWMEHLRQQDRYTMNDQKIQRRVYAFHQGEKHPEVRYLVAPM